MYENKEYFQKHKYRNPDDPIVRSFVEPKIKFMHRNGCFERRNLKILDIGSGNGTFSRYFVNYADIIVSLDYSAPLLMENSSRLKVRANAYKLPFKNNEFDIVFEANLLHHLDNPFEAIKEIKRCSREYVILIEPNRYNPIMAFFSLVVKAERGVLGSCLKRWAASLQNLEIKIIASTVTGMISQQNTPSFLVPILKLFDFKFFLGEYLILIGKKKIPV